MSTMTERAISYGEAIREATAQEMARDESVFVYGLGVDDPKGIFGTTLDLHKDFGPDRCFDTPLSEDAMTGLGIGAALAGMRPIHVHQRMDFLLLCMNQLVNLAAKSNYMFAGAAPVPLVQRAVIGRSWGQGAQHSQSFHSYFMHVPGLKVVAPSTPHDVKGTLISSIRDNNPVIFVEHRMLHRNVGIVPEAPYETPLGKARILDQGDDITIIGISHAAMDCVRAKHHLDEVGISAEVIDPVSLVPLDIDAIAQSVEKTGRLLVVDVGWLNCGASSEIVTQVFERLQGRCTFLVRRMGFAPSPCPTTKPLENAFYPSGKTIARAAYELVSESSATDWTPQAEEAEEVAEFRGPF